MSKKLDIIVSFSKQAFLRRFLQRHISYDESKDLGSWDLEFIVLFFKKNKDRLVELGMKPESVNEIIRDPFMYMWLVR